jgi:hypothetical protein
MILVCLILYRRFVDLSLTNRVIVDHPVRDRLPPGFNTAFKIVKEFIDPGLQCDAYADEPWLYGPSLSCWFAFRVGEKVKDTEDFPEPGEENVTREGADGSGQEERERLGLPENNEKRRKFFLDTKNRENFVFQKGRCYQADFFNPYLDFGNCALKLPGFSLNVIKYVDQKSHCLRYVFKNRETGNVYLNVNIALLWDEDLRRAKEADKEGDAALQACIGGQVEHTAKDSSPHDSLQADQEETKNNFGRNPDDGNISLATNSVEPSEEETKKDLRRSSDDEEISKATRSMHIKSGPNLDGKEGSTVADARPHDSSIADRDARPLAAGLTAVEHVSNGEAPIGVGNQHPSQPKGISITGVQANEVQDLLQATATSDKRGSSAGIF